MECKKGQTKKNRERKSLSGYIFGKKENIFNAKNKLKSKNYALFRYKQETFVHAYIIVEIFSVTYRAGYFYSQG